MKRAGTISRSLPREHRHTMTVEELANTTITGAQLNELVGGGYTTLHKHIVNEADLAGIVTNVMADLTLTDSHYILAVDASQGAVTITLPLATTYSKKTFIIKKMDASLNPVIVKAQGNDVIDGSVQFIINDQYNSMEIRTNGAAVWLNL